MAKRTLHISDDVLCYQEDGVDRIKLCDESNFISGDSLQSKYLMNTVIRELWRRLSTATSALQNVTRLPALEADAKGSIGQTDMLAAEQAIDRIYAEVLTALSEATRAEVRDEDRL